MAKQLFANNVSVTINEELTATDTTITVSSTAAFPTISGGDWIMATIVPQGGQGSREVVKITAISGNNLTVVRGQEGTAGQSFLFGSVLELRVTKGSLEELRDFTQSGTGASTGTKTDELKKIVRISQFNGADWGAKLQQAHDALPSSGGIIDGTDITGAQSVAADISITKPVRIYLGVYTVALGTTQLWIKASGVSIIGIAKSDENNSPSRFSSSRIGDAILLKHPTTATPLFGNVLADFEVSATGAAATSSSAFGISSYGTRYSEFRNIEVFNYQQGTALYFTGNGVVVNGFGATNTIINPAVSTCKFGIKVDTNGGSQSTHGCVYGGFVFGTTTGLDIDGESWRVYATDIGGTPGVKIRASSNDAVLTACRWEASTSEIVIDVGATATQIIGPSFINHQGGGAEITDNGANTIVITTSANTDSKLRGLRAQVNYANSGTTASLAAGASADVLSLSAGGIWLVGVRQSDGGTGWRASAIVYSDGTTPIVSTISSANVTITNNGAQLRLTNTHGSTAQALSWSVLKFEGARQF